MRLMIALFLLASCGNQPRCYNKEEAILACQVDEITRTGVDLKTARMLCEPYYPVEMCYEL
jgi:hypothetical protein